MNDTDHRAPFDWLALYAKFVVLATFALIFIGGHTTTAGAGMAFPDWPLSHGSVNPTGWWNDMMQRLEHGHRIAAETVALLIGILCAWVWRSRSSLPLAIAGSLLIALAAKWIGFSREIIAHLGLWSAAIIFVAALLFLRNDRLPPRPAPVRWLAFGAFLGVLAQAILGGLRVTIETAGNPTEAIIFRVLHGCFAHVELGLLVALAVLLSQRWARLTLSPGLHRIRVAASIALCAIFLQLIAGATMRHLGAGLAIPTFPHASPTGQWLPLDHSFFVDLHFAHSRIGAGLVTATIAFLLISVFRHSDASSLRRPALLVGVLLITQVLLGIFVIWEMRPPLLATMHVVTGAALLATTILIAVRASAATTISPSTRPGLSNRTGALQSTARVHHTVAATEATKVRA